MLRFIRVYGVYLTKSFKRQTMYQARVYTRWFLTVIQLVLLYSLWSAVYQGKNQIAGMSFSSMKTYVTLSLIFSETLLFGFLDRQIASGVRSGNIAVLLVRPVDIQLSNAMDNLGNVLYRVVFIGIPIGLISRFLFHVNWDISLGRASFVLLAIFMGFCLNVAIGYLFGIATFLTVNNWSLSVAKSTLMSFFSGSLIPISFFPGWLRAVARLMPFHAIVYIPLRIYVGEAVTHDIIFQLLIQALWTIIFCILARIFWLFLIKRLVIQGG